MSKKYRKKNKTVSHAPEPLMVKPLAAQPSRFAYLLLPHNVFAILALVFGFLFLVTTPPFQVPDECAHVNRAYELSEFKLWQQVKDNKPGNYLPASLDSAAQRFTYLWFDPGQKSSVVQISDAFDIKLDRDKTKFIASSAGSYSYFSYIPQLPAVFIGRLFNMNVLSMLYLGRFFALLFYVLCCWLAIRMIPFGKFLLLLVALLPMTLAQAASFSPDCVTFSLSFLAMALLLDISFSSEPLRLSAKPLALVVIVCLLGLLKPVYLPLAFLVFFIPRSRFKNLTHYLAATLLTVTLAVAMTLGWLKMVSAHGAVQTNVDINGDKIAPAAKVQEFLHHPSLVFDVLNKTLGHFHEMYYRTTLGVFGYLDTHLSQGLYGVLTFLLIFIALFEADRRYSLFVYQRLLLFIVSVGIFLGTILTMYLLTRLDSGLITEGVQGRYFIPALFPFFLSVYGLLPWRMNLFTNRLSAGILYIILLVILINAESTLYTRYFVDV